MVALGFLITDVLPSTALGKWDAEVPNRLVEYRQQDGNAESKLITTLSETLTIITDRDTLEIAASLYDAAQQKFLWCTRSE